MLHDDALNKEDEGRDVKEKAQRKNEKCKPHPCGAEYGEDCKEMKCTRIFKCDAKDEKITKILSQYDKLISKMSEKKSNKVFREEARQKKREGKPLEEEEEKAL